GIVDLSLLDEAVEELCTKFLYTMPDCLIKTIESLRKHKLEHWDRNRESNRAWLSLNMMTEANAGFRAFHYGTKEQREVDFVRLRQRLAQGARWNEELIGEIAPWVRQEEKVSGGSRSGQPRAERGKNGSARHAKRTGGFTGTRSHRDGWLGRHRARDRGRAHSSGRARDF